VRETGFLDLPLEIRDMIYKLVAESSQDVKIRARNTLQFQKPEKHIDLSRPPKGYAYELIDEKEENKGDDKAAQNASDTTKHHKHNLHNLMRVNKYLYIDAKQALYRHVPIRVWIGAEGSAATPLRHAFHITKMSYASDYLDQLKQCAQIDLMFAYYGFVALPTQEELRCFLEWWHNVLPKSMHTRLRVCLPLYFRGYTDLHSILDKWLSTLSASGDYYAHVCLSFNEYQAICVKSLRECKVNETWLNWNEVDFAKAEVSWMRAFYRRHLALIEKSPINWAALDSKDLDENGMETVSYFHYYDNYNYPHEVIDHSSFWWLEGTWEAVPAWFKKQYLGPVCSWETHFRSGGRR